MRFSHILLIVLSGSLVCACYSERNNKQLKPPKNGNIYVIAHRGAHQGIPENSLAAYQKAIDLGVDFVEVDIRTTKEGKYVSIHNRTIDAYVEGKTGEIKDFTLAELKSLDIGKRIGPEWEGTRIPTFEEILDLCKDKCGIYLDLKAAQIPALVNIIKDKEMVNDVIWCLGDYNEMSELNKTCPECILTPDPGDLVEFSRILAEFKPIVVAPVWRDLSKELIKMSHDAGALIIVDEKDKDSWAQALEWGVNGIQTNHPGELIQYLTTKEK
jgi:glycerophosphoryl diester phosphodiesterase